MVKGRFRDQEVGSESVGFLFFALGFLILCAVGCLNEHIALAVLEDVGALVEKCEPEKVISFTSEAELEDGFSRGKPAGRAIGASGRELRR